MKTIVRSLAAVIAGYLVAAILTIVTVPVLGMLVPATLDASNGWSVWLNVAYGVAFAALGGYVTARISPSKPLMHAIILAAIMAGLALLTGAAIKNAPPSSEYAMQPDWYYPVLAVTSLLAVPFGAWLFERKNAKAA